MAKYVSSSYLASGYVAPSWFGDGTVPGRYVAKSYLAVSYVRDSWFGQGTIVAVGKYIGANYLRPGYINPNYVTNVGIPPTTIQVGDTLSIGVGEQVGTPRKMYLLVADTLGVSFAESFNINYKRHVVAFETVNLTVGEQQTSRLTKTVTDTLGVSFTEFSATSKGTLTQIAVSDTLGITLDDAGINQGIEVYDTLGTALTEASSYIVKLQRADTLGVAFAEASSRTIAGTILRQVSDSLNLSLGESTNLHVFKQISALDTLDVQLDDVASIEQGIVTVYLQAFDELSLTSGEVASISNIQEVVGLASSDTLSLSFGEQSSKVELHFFSVGDTLLLQVLEGSQVAKISVQQTWEDAQYPWGGSTLRDIKPLPVFAYEFDFYQADSADTFITPQGIQGIPVVLERLGLTIYGRDRQGQWKEDPDLVKLVKGLYPIIRAEPGTVVNIYVGAQEDMEGAITWDGPHPFIVGTDTSVKPLISGPFIAVRFESAGQKPWKLLSYDLDITTVGRRN